MKKLLFSALTAVAVVLMASCSGGSSTKNVAQKLSAMLPVNVVEGVQATALTTDDNVQLTLDIDDETYHLDSVALQKSDLAQALMSYFYGGQGAFGELVAAADGKLPFRFVIKGAKGGQEQAVDVAAADVASMVAQADKPLLKLRQQLAFVNLASPSYLNDYAQMGRVVITDKEMVVPILADAKTFDARLTDKEAKEFMERTIASDSRQAIYADLARKAGLSVRYTYGLATGGKQFELVK